MTTKIMGHPDTVDKTVEQLMVRLIFFLLP